MTTDDEVTRYHREKDIPLALQKKLELLRHFTEYMDDFLTEGELAFFLFHNLLYILFRERRHITELSYVSEFCLSYISKLF